jgi:hypothetical protein
MTTSNLGDVVVDRRVRFGLVDAELVLAQLRVAYRVPSVVNTTMRQHNKTRRRTAPGVGGSIEFRIVATGQCAKTAPSINSNRIMRRRTSSSSSSSSSSVIAVPELRCLIQTAA